VVDDNYLGRRVKIVDAGQTGAGAEFSTQVTGAETSYADVALDIQFSIAPFRTLVTDC
jgi:hypothetical protein